jgi:hypothetical protein
MSNSEIIELINSTEHIRDNQIIKLQIHFDNEINIKLKFIDRKSKSLELSFLNVQSYNISGLVEFDKNGILVTHYKLFVFNDSFVYFSFDPFDEEKIIDDNDNNFIISKSLTLKWI